MLDINFAQIFILFVVLLFSLTIHEMAHAWTADRLGDPTARLLGRVSLNPIVHADPIGTVVFPLVSIVSGATLIGWAKPVPVNVRYLRHPRSMLSPRCLTMSLAKPHLLDDLDGAVGRWTAERRLPEP